MILTLQQTKASGQSLRAHFGNKCVCLEIVWALFVAKKESWWLVYCYSACKKGGLMQRASIHPICLWCLCKELFKGTVSRDGFVHPELKKVSYKFRDFIPLHSFLRIFSACHPADFFHFEDFTLHIWGGSVYHVYSFYFHVNKLANSPKSLWKKFLIQKGRHTIMLFWTPSHNYNVVTLQYTFSYPWCVVYGDIQGNSNTRCRLYSIWLTNSVHVVY